MRKAYPLQAKGRINISRLHNHLDQTEKSLLDSLYDFFRFIKSFFLNS